jgi:hypothetical protein
MKVKSLGANKTEIHQGDFTIFFSYETPVACHIRGQGYFRTSKKWSATTSKHITVWLREQGDPLAEQRPQEFFDALLGD